MPAGAVDCHAHVIGAPPAFEFVAARSYTPPPASPEAYIGMLDGTGIAYGVLVQVSVHGTDNRLLLQTLTTYPERLRGVAVPALGLPDRDYAAMKSAGVVGIRLNGIFGGGTGFAQVQRYDRLAQELGWHVQLLISARELHDMRRQIARFKSPIVIDHMAFPRVADGVGARDFQTLLDLVRDGAWVKLSGAFRMSAAGPPYADTIPFARALLEAACEHCVWGSDWPHVAFGGRMMTVGALLDLLADWAPEAALQHQVLVENPRVLYGF
jgi:predicted TIM-barrel fold metal-dependent hydrolase